MGMFSDLEYVQDKGIVRIRGAKVNKKLVRALQAVASSFWCPQLEYRVTPLPCEGI